jgi:hypothetical protein
MGNEIEIARQIRALSPDDKAAMGKRWLEAELTTTQIARAMEVQLAQAETLRAQGQEGNLKLHVEHRVHHSDGDTLLILQSDLRVRKSIFQKIGEYFSNLVRR